MNDLVRGTLKTLVAQYGTDLCTNRQRLEGLLRDYCGQHKREINVLVAAVRERVAEDLLKVLGTQVDALLFHRLVRRMHEEAGIAEAFAAWAVESWAIALGKGVPESVPEQTSEVRPQGARLQSEVWRVTNPKDDAPMVLIPAGEFRMGSNDYDDEKPVHPVYLDAFYMDVYEVTNARYQKFMRATRHPAPYYWNDSNYNAPDQPVVGVTWYDAAAYCQWAGKHLPTEAEWEKAARGGLVGKKYPWGDSIDSSKANYDRNVGRTTPVGKYPPNGYSLYDMAGNVWEWCQDEYDSDFYAQSPKNNPVAGGDINNIVSNYKSIKTGRVLRGGSWYGDGDLVRVANRLRVDPDAGSVDDGFRGSSPRVPR